jgi:hypothetical protein
MHPNGPLSCEMPVLWTHSFILIANIESLKLLRIPARTEQFLLVLLFIFFLDKICVLALNLSILPLCSNRGMCA